VVRKDVDEVLVRVLVQVELERSGGFVLGLYVAPLTEQQVAVEEMGAVVARIERQRVAVSRFGGIGVPGAFQPAGVIAGLLGITQMVPGLDRRLWERWRGRAGETHGLLGAQIWPPAYSFGDILVRTMTPHANRDVISFRGISERRGWS
jgi:hypothetical protein